MTAARILPFVVALFALPIAACSSSDSSTQPSFSPEMVAAAGDYQLTVVNGAPVPKDLGAVSGTTCPHVVADGGTLTLSYSPSGGANFSLTMTAHGECPGQTINGGNLGFGFSGTWSLANGALVLRPSGPSNGFSILSSAYNGGGVTVNVAWSFPQTTLTYTR